MIHMTLSHFYFMLLQRLPRGRFLDPHQAERQLQWLMQWDLGDMSAEKYRHHW